MSNDDMPVQVDAIGALKQCVAWLEHHKARVHHPMCTAVIAPSPRCSCGLHKVLTDLRGVISDMEILREQP